MTRKEAEIYLRQAAEAGGSVVERLTLGDDWIELEATGPELGDRQTFGGWAIESRQTYPDGSWTVIWVKIETEDRVLAALDAWTIDELVERTGLSYARVAAAVESLRRQGLIHGLRRIPPRMWRATDERSGWTVCFSAGDHEAAQQEARRRLSKTARYTLEEIES